MSLSSRLRALERRVRETVCPWWKTREGQVRVLQTTVAMHVATCPPSPRASIAQYRKECLDSANALAKGWGWEAVAEGELELAFPEGLRSEEA